MNTDWTQVVTHPLGLAGFALALVFGVAGIRTHGKQRAWFLPLAIGLAGLVMIGGFYLAYLQTGAFSTPAELDHGQVRSGAPPPPETVIQQTQGQGSPAIQGVGGDVTLTNTPPPPKEDKLKEGKK